jgi:hypothetical protein
MRWSWFEVVAVRLVITVDDNDVMSETILLPIIGLNLSRTWEVGQVRLHPAGAAAGLIEAARAGSQPDTVLQPEEQSQVLQASARLNRCVVAEVSVSRAGASRSRSSWLRARSPFSGLYNAWRTSPGL